ncbi:MAG: YbaB/EbfC family nucleoid-associated protein [Candidatus Komeilibacteria bacterium]
MFNKLKQFNDLRKQANSIKNKLAVETVTIETGAVKLVIDGNQEVKSLNISSEWLRPEKKQALENELLEAMNKGLKKVQRIMAEKVREMGGLNLPGFGGSDKQ